MEDCFFSCALYRDESFDWQPDALSLSLALSTADILSNFIFKAAGETFFCL